MNFREKLKLLGGQVNKAEKARSVGLPATMISTYIAKGSIPRGDIALKMARALDVPVDWLLDDSKDFPPPKVKSKSLEDALDSELMAEVGRRKLDAALDLLKEIEQASKFDWDKLSIEAHKLSESSSIPTEITVAFETVRRIESKEERLFATFDDRIFMALLYSERRRDDKSLPDFRQAKARYDEFMGRAGVKAFNKRFIRDAKSIDFGAHGDFRN